MKTKFLTPSDPQLTKAAKEILLSQISSPEIKKIAEVMLKIIKGEQKKLQKGVGLAAPQIGILKRIILVDIAASKKGVGGDLRIYVNPKIIWKSKREGEWYEGCYSTGKVCGIVSRPTSIKIEGLNIDGKLIQEKYTGYMARIFQHEIDHLDGKVFIDLIKDPNKLHLVEKKEFPLYRNQEAWRNWPKKAPLPIAINSL